MSKRSEKREVSAEIASGIADEMRNAIGVAAGPRTWEDTRESWLWRAAHRLGIEPRRAKAFWYREARRIEAAEYVQVKTNLAQLEARANARDHELQALAAARARTAAALVGGVERPDGEHLERLGQVGDPTRGQD